MSIKSYLSRIINETGGLPLFGLYENGILTNENEINELAKAIMNKEFEFKIKDSKKGEYTIYGIYNTYNKFFQKHFNREFPLSGIEYLCKHLKRSGNGRIIAIRAINNDEDAKYIIRVFGTSNVEELESLNMFEKVEYDNNFFNFYISPWYLLKNLEYIASSYVNK